MKTHAQAVVIGGGLIGCSILYHLARAGWRDVVLLERDELTSGSTWHAAANIHGLHDNTNISRLQHYTMNLYKQLEAETGQGCGVFQAGSLYLAQTEAREHQLRLQAAKAKLYGMNFHEISRDEAEVLFRLNDRTSEAQNDPSWTELFTKAVAYSLMAVSGYELPSRQEALRREEWVDDSSVNLGGFFSRMLSGSLGAHMDAIGLDTGSEAYYARRNAETDRLRSEHERVDAEEADWLAHRIGRDGKLHENEKQLLGFLKKESPHVHPALQPLFDKVA